MSGKYIPPEEWEVVPAHPGLVLAAHPGRCFSKGGSGVKIEKKHITGKPVFFGEPGIGKGFQLFLIFLTETGGLSRVRKCSSKSCLGLSDTFFFRVCKSVVKGEGIAAYFGPE